ncbi:MAG TPA: FG-GAP-like repeat-containing protein [Gemmataceae bacterium]
MSLNSLQCSRSRHISKACFEALEARQLLSFSPATSFPVGASPQAIATADFNNDGRLDVATANSGSDSVSVLLGNGNGSFQPAKTAATGPYPVSLAAGDFNADGKLDLAIANQDVFTDTGDSDVSILLGKGDGTFAAAVALNISEFYSWSIATGDLNADGKLDLVVTSDNDGAGGYMSTLLGHGDGTFAAASTYGPYFGPSGVNQLLGSVLADVNGDGKLDVAVAAWQSSSVKVFLGNGDGTLLAPRDFATERGSNSVAAGDFNADGKLDLVTANHSNTSNSVSMLLGNGDGTFQTARSFAAGTGPTSATASDVNGDGKLDLVVLSSGGVSVLLGNGNGSLAGPITSTTGGGGSVAMADFNGDGRPDAAAANAGSNNVSVLLNDGAWPGQTTLPRITINDVSKAEGKGNTSFTFTVSLSAACDQPVTVSYRSVDGTAMGGSDYTSTSGAITFAPGQTTKTITIQVKGDNKPEPNETFYLELFSNSSNSVLTRTRGIGTILDDDNWTARIRRISQPISYQ